MMNPLISIGAHLRAWREKYLKDKYIVRFLVFIWFYSLIIAVFNDRYKLLLQQTKSEIPYYGMLMKTERGYHFYDFTNLNFDITTQDLEENGANDVTVTPIALEELALPVSGSSSGQTIEVSVLKDDTLLVRTDKIAKIFDTTERQNYSLFSESNKGVAVGKTGSVYYKTTKDGVSSLNIYFAACKSPTSIPLSNTSGVSETLSTFGLPVQKVLKISTTEHYAAVLDHETQRRVTIVDMFQNSVADLYVPEFGPDQIHFSPTFISSTAIAFSVMGGETKATVLYDIKQDTYTILSNDFSDAIYVSRLGKIVMAQSFNLRSGNVPYGSMALMQKQSKITRSEILSIVGTDETLWRRLFVNPTDEFLTFKEDANERFTVIEDTQIRREISEYWSQIYDPTIPKEMELKLMEWNPQGPLQTASIIYTVNKGHPLLVWSFDFSPLLQALGFPDSVISMYKKNHSENPNVYTLENLQ